MLPVEASAAPMATGSAAAAATRNAMVTTIVPMTNNPTSNRSVFAALS